MKKRKFYMVQVDVAYGSGSATKSAYFPYAVGLLSAFALSDPEIAQAYELGGLAFLREEMEEAVNSLEAPFLVGFSNYVWNTEYNKKLAQQIKKQFPDCWILFGGHNVPPDNSFLEEYPFIDFLIHGEGEMPFRALLRELMNEVPSFDAVPGLSYRAAEGLLCKTPTLIPQGLDYPSPYLEGYFDSLIRNNANIKFSAILETSRGCPYQCAYCDWAQLNAKIRQFPMERIVQEIDWMSANRVEFIWGADSNFGFFDRDETIMDYILEKKNETGYPEKIYINYAKNNEDTVFNIVKKLNCNRASKFGATLSFQSLSPAVLENIGRKNMTFDHFKRLMLRYNKEHIRTYSELIIGLPGETYESFCKGIGILLEAGQHNAIECYRCILLPNSKMGQKDFQERFGIISVKAMKTQVHCDVTDVQTDEISEFVIQTDSMPVQDWIRANQFAAFVQSLHGFGLLRYIAIYLHYEKGISYEDFYNALLSFSEKEEATVLQEAFLELKVNNEKAAFDHVLEPLCVFPICSLTWSVDEFLFLRLLYEVERFYKDVYPFLQRYFDDALLLQQLFHYQKEMIKLPTVKEKQFSLQYDFPAYFQNIYMNTYAPLEKRNARIRICDAAPTENWEEYARHIVWYNRFGGSSLHEGNLMKEDDGSACE